MDYDDMTNDDYDRILADIMDEGCASALLLIPGVYEVVSEYFNNEVLKAWEWERLLENEADTGEDM